MRGKVSAKYPLTRTRVRMAVALVAAAPLAFTADNFPECTPAPACYPNRRAPHHGSLLNGACATLGSALQQVVQRQGHVLALEAQLGP